MDLLPGFRARDASLSPFFLVSGPSCDLLTKATLAHLRSIPNGVFISPLCSGVCNPGTMDIE
jgi:hypothetical protein